ncbi:methyl-accepting chemotaxis protein [Paenibacillus sp. 598K]|uniref:methyl-accepting chemotaxis protein n=1 Tax=Paenibacillus sp. 598K TaxID=1117987 RepID=UPI0016255A8C|nr:methyl-accepting chemotaxis protein [Paenibacillus sp. 598K]
MKTKGSSLAVKGSLMLMLLILCADGVLMYSSYRNQNAIFLDGLSRLGTKLQLQLDSAIPTIESAIQRVEAGKIDNDPALDVLKYRLEAMVDDEYISNAYLLLLEPASTAEGTGYTMLQVTPSLRQAGLYPGAVYPANDVFVRGVRDTSASGQSTLTAPYTDAYGESLTQFHLLTDAMDEPIALLALDYRYDYVRQMQQTMLRDNAMLSLIIAVLATATGMYALRRSIGPIKQLASLSAAAAQGDLTVSLPHRKRDEIGGLSSAFNAMVGSLRQLTGEISASASHVGTAAERMESQARETAAATAASAGALDEVAVGSSTQLRSSQQCQRAMDEMATGISRIAEASAAVSELTVLTSRQAESGGVMMERSLQQMEMISAELTEASDTVAELRASNQQIGAITTLIAELAAQTHLLALNASIEAARAGEHGRGFAVVAGEIRQLAEQSDRSSRDIHRLLATISEMTERASRELTRTAGKIRDGSASVSQAGEAFRDIVDSIRTVSGQVQEVSASSEQLSAGTEEIAASLAELEQIADRSAARTRYIAEGASAQLALMQSVQDSASELRTEAADLTAAVRRFRL